MTPDEKIAADKAAADKAVADTRAADVKMAEKSGAVEGAQSVAEAVRRIADAAVAEVKKTTPGPAPELQFSGTPGGGFVITGSGFGTSGTVHVGGVDAPTTSWSTTRIEGALPQNVPTGEVVVQVDDKTARRGRFVRV